MKNLPLLPAAALAATLALTLALTPALSRADEAAELDDLPAAVQKTAHAQVGASKIEEVETTYEDGQHATEVEYLQNGKKMAVVIAKDGTLIQTEYRMSPADAPAVIKTAVTAKYPDGVISHIQEVERPSGKFFELSVKTPAKSHQMILDDSGNPVKPPQ
jgi:hypothetical protein